MESARKAAHTAPQPTVSAELGERAALRPRVLLMAYHCHPESNMESRLGWNRALHAAKHCDTWVLFARHNNASELPAMIRAAGVEESLHLIHVPHNRIEQVLSRKFKLFYRAYDLWHRRAYRVVKQMHSELRFDLIHQVSFCGYRQPGYLWKLDVPFVLGPVGGTQNFPWRFLPTVDFPGAVREATRNLMNVAELWLSPKVRRACRKASVVLAANRENQRDLIRSQKVPVILQLETGTEPCSDSITRRATPNQPLRILWTGRLRTWKALPILLRALAQLPATCDFELRVLGVGNCERRWKRLAQRLGVAHAISWCGWGDYSEVLPHYQWADVFAFTSLRDTSGAGLLDALAAGTPIIGVDHQGATDIMTDDCAIRVPVSSPTTTIAGFRDAIVALDSDRELLARLSEGARERASEFNWERQGEAMKRVYRHAIYGEPLSPSLAMPARLSELASETTCSSEAIACRHAAASSPQLG